MSEETETVTVSKSYLEGLEADRDWLECLEAAGVDNWSGIEEAIDLKKEREVLV